MSTALLPHLLRPYFLMVSEVLIIQDESGRIWPLVSVGTIQPQSSATIWRNGMPMSLNNAGDEIVLVDPSNQIRDRFEYTGSQEGVLIQTGH